MDPRKAAVKNLINEFLSELNKPAKAAVKVTEVVAPQDEALRLAQQRAALPPAQGGLGLPANNTPMQRAAAMRRDTGAYHGSKQDITGAFKPGYDDNLAFVTKSPDFANKWIGKGKHTQRTGDQAKQEVKAADEIRREIRSKHIYHDDALERLQGEEFNNEYDRRSALANAELDREFPNGMVNNIHSTVYPLTVESNKIFNPETDMDVMLEFFEKNGVPQANRDLYAGGNYMMYETKPVVDYLKSKGYDSMRLRESTGDDYPTIAVFNPESVRSRFAAHDPFRRDAATAAAFGVAAPDLLAQEQEKAAGGDVHMAGGGDPTSNLTLSDLVIGKEKHDPVTIRKRLTSELEKLLSGSMSPQAVQRISQTAMGGDKSMLPIGIGVADFVPFLGSGMGVEEAARDLPQVYQDLKNKQYLDAAIGAGFDLWGLLPGAAGTAAVGRAALRKAKPISEVHMDKGGSMKNAVKDAVEGLRNYIDPIATRIFDWNWRPMSDVRQEVPDTEVPEYIQKGYGDFMAEQAKRAAAGDLNARDLIKAYTITRSSVNRGGLPYNTATKTGMQLPRTQGLVRPEGAFAEWLGSPAGQRYLDQAEKGTFTESDLSDMVNRFAPFGMPAVLADDMRYAARSLSPKGATISADVMASPDVYREVSQQLKGIGPAKSGFMASLLGRGDYPTFDARQIRLHTGQGGKDAAKYMTRGKGVGGEEAVARLADRQRAMNMSLDPSLDPFYQHLVHHTVWDRLGNEQTTHSDLVKAMRGYAGGGDVSDDTIDEFLSKQGS
jgi:hypothetical protein